MDISQAKRTGILAALLWASFLTPARAVPPGFNIQGRLTDANGVNREGNYTLQFTIFDAPIGGAALWTRTYPALTVRNGNFQTVLEDVPGQPMLSGVFAAGDSRHLEIQVMSGPGVSPVTPEPPLVPRQRLVSVPYAMKAAVADAVLAPGVPTGTVLPFASDIAPTGFLECNGSAVSRTTYAALFTVIGTRYGSGDGSTTFTLPDLRGTFVRGWSHGASDAFADPNAASRVARYTGGVTGDNVGSFQQDQFKSHTHTYQNPSIGGSDVFNRPGRPTPLPDQTGAAGGSETRPKNVNLMYVIKI